MENHNPNTEALDHLTAEPAPTAEATDATDGAPDASHEIQEALDELRQLMGRADALASTTDEQFSRVVVLGEGADRRGFRRLTHLVELTATAVMDASDASDKLIDAVERALPPERTTSTVAGPLHAEPPPPDESGIVP